jgi:hypothetical protein
MELVTNAVVQEALSKRRSAAEHYTGVPRQSLTHSTPSQPEQSIRGTPATDDQTIAASIMQFLPTVQQGATSFRLLKPAASNNGLLQPPVPLAKMTATSTARFLQAQRKANADMLREGSIKIMGVLFLRSGNEAAPVKV